MQEQLLESVVLDRHLPTQVHALPLVHV
jgi:hypothetical protein